MFCCLCLCGCCCVLLFVILSFLTEQVTSSDLFCVIVCVFGRGVRCIFVVVVIVVVVVVVAAVGVLLLFVCVHLLVCA